MARAPCVRDGRSDRDHIKMPVGLQTLKGECQVGSNGLLRGRYLMLRVEFFKENTGWILEKLRYPPWIIGAYPFAVSPHRHRPPTSQGTKYPT
jgi:hypothetical protein